MFALAMQVCFFRERYIRLHLFTYKVVAMQVSQFTFFFIPSEANSVFFGPHCSKTRRKSREKKVGNVFNLVMSSS